MFALEQLTPYALPTMLAAGMVWLASAVSWMVLPHHRGEYRGVRDESALRDALLSQELTRGQYTMPWLDDWQQMSTPEGRRRFTEGPVVFLTVLTNQVPSVRRHLLLTLAHYVLVSGGVVAALALLGVPGSTDYRDIFPSAAVIALLAHGSAIIPEAIWYGKPWGNVLRSLLDAAAFALLTAGAIAGTWPSS